MMYYFLIQNKYHSDNFYPIADELVKAGIPKSKILFIHFDNVFKQETYIDNYETFNKIFPETDLDLSFYKLNSFERVKFILKNKSYFLSLIDLNAEDSLIAGNDGAIQRLFINELNKKRGKSYLLLDGNLALNEGLNFLMKKVLFKCAEFLGFSFLVPSIRGHSKVEKTFVMHDCIKQILLKEGVKSEVESFFFPRYWKLTEINKSEEGKNKNHWNILYITSAFKWHGAINEHKKQLTDLEELDMFLSNINEVSVTAKIRIHPREFIEDYENLNFKNLSYDKSSDYIDILKWADIIITTVSTMAYEAIITGKLVYLYNKNIDINQTLLCMGGDGIKKINDYSEIEFEQGKIISANNRKKDVSSFIKEVTL